MTAKRFTKVVVDGEIQLGERLELVQQPRTDASTARSVSFNVAGYAGLDAISPKDAGALGQVMEFHLQPSQGDLHIKGAGLVTSFGIFGAPGSGKTVMLMHLLEQVLGHSAGDPSRRYGALILDPKASLISDVEAMVARLGRQDDLVVINTQYLDEARRQINVIDCTLDAQELGAILVLAGRSAGVDASDPFWFQEWSNLFASSLSISRLAQSRQRTMGGKSSVSLEMLVSSIFDEVPDGRGGKRRVIQSIAAELLDRAARRPGTLSPAQLRELELDSQQLDRFFKQDYVGTVEAFITKAFGMFRRPRLACYSSTAPRVGKLGFYEDLIENGRIVLVSISPSEPVLAKTLCTLVKCLFQRTVLARGDLLASGTMTNAVRPLVLACDEYSEIASEVPGQSMGDGQFLALARQYGCMALLATQSVNVLEASSLKEAWKSVFSNFAAKIYMRLADNETAEEATKLAGESDWKIVSRGKTMGQEGSSASRQQELRERKNLPSIILTQVLKTGQAVAIGSLDGGKTPPGTHFVKVPFRDDAPPAGGAHA